MQGLLEKLQSDTTRLAAVKAFGRIAESPLPLDMAPVLDRLLTELTSYLRKSNRLLRQAALAAIEVCTSIRLSCAPWLTWSASSRCRLAIAAAGQYGGEVGSSNGALLDVTMQNT